MYVGTRASGEGGIYLALLVEMLLERGAKTVKSHNTTLNGIDLKCEFNTDRKTNTKLMNARTKRANKTGAKHLAR